MSSLFKSKKTEKQETQIDPRVYNEVLQNLGIARQISQLPFQAYTGPMVAPFTRDYMTGEAMTRAIAGEGGFVPEVEGAARSAAGLMGFTPQQVAAERVGTQFAPERVAAQQLGTTFGARDVGASLAGGPQRVTAGQVAGPAAFREIAAGRVGTTFAPERVGAGRVGTTFAARDIAAPGAAPTVQAASFLGRDVGGDIGAYTNPYQQGVIDVGLSDIDRAAEQARMQRSQRATAARAFGGSRAAIEEGIAAGEAARERNRFVAEQRAQAYREAAALREADVGRQQQAAIANQAAAQEVMRLAQAGQISNQERDLQLAQLGLTAETANVEAGMRAALANQQAVQEAQRMGLTAEQANVQAQLEAERANQAAQMQREELAARTGQFNVQAGLEAGRANQQAVENYMRMGLSAEQANQQANLDAQRLGLTAGQANQEAAMRAALANQQAAQQAQQMGLQAQGMNQDAAMRAALANQQMGLQGAQFQLGAGRQFADLGQQALGNRYGAAAAMTGLGSAQQQLMQQQINAQREEFMRRVNYPLQQLAVAQGAVAASPYNQTTLGTVTSRPNLWQIAGQVIPAADALSDERLKYDIAPIKNPLDKVNRLEGVSFKWKDDDEDDVSVIAQDVEKVMPEAISEREDGMKMVGLPQMVGLLTGAVQELDKKVEGKKRRGKKK